MKYRVRLAAKAEADVDGVLRWFRDQQATAAGGRWFARLMVKIDTLETHPDRCAIAVESEELGVEIRELLFGRRHGVLAGPLLRTGSPSREIDRPGSRSLLANLGCFRRSHRRRFSS
jgi:plasmid stabilization system protein ParE